MKHNGKPLSRRYTKRVVLPRPDGESLVFTIGPLSLGFQQRLRSKNIRPPTPPTRVARDSQGKPLRDADGLAVFTEDKHDHDYEERLERYHQHVAVLVAAEALKADESIEFDAQEPEQDDWTLYADALVDEFEADGWSAGDLILLCDEFARLSNLLDDHLRESAADFFTPAACPPSNTPCSAAANDCR